MISDTDIKDALYMYLKTTRLAKEVNGEICKRGKRNPESTSEDIVLSVVANELGQKQSLVVYVNVYVQDDYVKPHSQNEEKTVRLKTLCNLCMDALETFRLDDARVVLTSQRVLEAGNDKEHVISNKLICELINED